LLVGWLEAGPVASPHSPQAAPSGAGGLVELPALKLKFGDVGFWGSCFQVPTDRAFFTIVHIHSCCFHQLCNKSLLSCPATEAIGELLVPLLSRGFPPLDPPHKDPLRRADRMRGNCRHGSGSSSLQPTLPAKAASSRPLFEPNGPEPTGAVFGKRALQGPSRRQSAGFQRPGHRHGLQSSERGRGRCKRHGIRRLRGNQPGPLRKHMIQTRHQGELHVCTID
jgi:hypothetical protein